MTSPVTNALLRLMVEESMKLSVAPTQIRSSMFITSESCAIPYGSQNKKLSLTQKIPLYTHFAYLPDGKIPGFFPIEVSEHRLCACAICVDDEAMVWISAKVVGHDFAEGFGEEAFVYIADGGVHIFLVRGNTALRVAISHAS